MQIVVEGPLLAFLGHSDHLVEFTQLILMHVIFNRSTSMCNCIVFCANWLQKYINVQIFFNKLRRSHNPIPKFIKGHFHTIIHSAHIHNTTNMLMFFCL